MAQIGQPYDPGAHKPREAFELIPNGWYATQITASEIKQTKDQQGQYLHLTVTFLETHHPELKGRMCWDRLNIWNQSQKAVDIANATLSAICKAIGQVDQWTDSNILHNRPLAVKIRIELAQGQYAAKNEISGYKSLAEAFQGPGAPQAAAPQAAAPQAAAASQAAPQAPPPQTAPPAGHPPQAVPAAPQGQPGQVSVPPWQQKDG